MADGAAMLTGHEAVRKRLRQLNDRARGTNTGHRLIATTLVVVVMDIISRDFNVRMWPLDATLIFLVRRRVRQWLSWRGLDPVLG